MGRSLRGRFSGVVRYTFELVQALEPRLGSALTVFLTRAPDGLDGLGVSVMRAPFPTPNEYARALWEQSVVPLQVARLRPDVYHSPNYILPLALNRPSVVTIHDLAYLDRSIHRLRSHLYISRLGALAVRKATRVICVSAYTRDQLLRIYPAAEAKVRVVGEGIDERFHPAGPDEVEAVRRRHGLERPYLLFVGTVEPRKNLARLIQAFGHAVRRSGLPHELVLAGGRGWKDAAIYDAWGASAVKDRIRFLGYVADGDLPPLYSGAEVLCYPSLEEGFGLPPLEAMACGTPVLTSDRSALPEVTGEAALLVDPLDEEAIACGLERLGTSGGLRSDLARRGLERAARFRWDRVATETLAVYTEAAGA